MIETEISTVVALRARACNHLLWLVAALNGLRQKLSDDLWQVDLPTSEGAMEMNRLLLVPSGTDGSPPLSADHPWLQRLAECAREQGPLQARPCQQPQHWHDIERQLLAPYHVQGGEKSVAACTFDERPLLRLTFARSPHNGPLEVENVVCDEFGNALASQLVEQLHLDDLEVQEQPPVRRLGQDWLREWVAQSIEQLEDHDLETHLIAATVVWCKYAEGKIALTLGGRRAEVFFEGWAELLAQGILQPPPFCCPSTGILSYSIAATDDGSITAAEAIAVCEHSGARARCNELARCADTGALVLTRYLQVCPITNAAAVPSAFETCDCCRQQVRRLVLSHRICQACGSLQPVRKCDPRLARLLGEYPRLDRWRRWTLAETSSVYVLVAQSWFRRLLIVVQKTDLQPHRVAVARRRRGEWHDVDESDRGQLLGDL